MGYRITVINEKIQGNLYEIGLLSKTDSKNYSFKFISDVVLTDNEIKTKLETITDCWVESIKRVTKYKRVKEKVPDVSGVVLMGRYDLNGQKVRTDSLFLPLVKKEYVEWGTLETELNDFFSPINGGFEIKVYSPR